MLDREVLFRYKADWQSISKAHRHAKALRPALAKVMDYPLPQAQRPDRWQHLLHKDDSALQDMA